MVIEKLKDTEYIQETYEKNYISRDYNTVRGKQFFDIKSASLK